MTLADRFDLPVLTFVDTPGAYPGIGAEERGQAEAIARCIDVCLSIRVPIISVVIGEAARRRHRPSNREPCRHAGAQHLFGNFTRGMRINPLAQCDKRRQRGGPSPHGAGSPKPRSDRRGRSGARRRRASGPECGHPQPRRADAHDAQCLLALDGDELRERRRKSSSRWANRA